jgi:hypothetical protein
VHAKIETEIAGLFEINDLEHRPNEPLTDFRRT